MKSARLLVCVVGFSLVSASAAADGAWIARGNVGTGGTDWTAWSDSANWEGGVVPGADGRNAAADLTSVAAQYIRLPDGTLTFSKIGAAGNAVFIGDGTYVLGHESHTDNPSACSLYFPFKISVGSVYCGFGTCDICTVPTGASGSRPLIMGTVGFRYDRFATEAGESRTVVPWPTEIALNGYSAVKFYAPEGLGEATVSHWTATAGSPYLKKAAEDAAHALPVGTTVTGEGIPDGTFLKRVFPDGTIELSAAPEVSGAAHALTFAAFAAKTEVKMNNRFSSFNSTGKRTICVQKRRVEDDIVLSMNPNGYSLQGLTGSENHKYTFTTDAGYLPGRIAFGTVYAPDSMPAVLYLENCHFELAGDNAYWKNTSARVDNAAHTARITVPDGASSRFARLEKMAGTLVKDGSGVLTMEMPASLFTAVTGPVVIEEGTFAPTFAVAGTNRLASLTVKAGARVDIPAGTVLCVDELTVEDGAVFGGFGRVCVDGFPAESLEKIVLEEGVCFDDGRSAAAFSIEVLEGAPRAVAEDGDSIWILDTNALFRVNGTGVFDLLVVGGGGGGGSKNGGGGGGGGVVYTQNVTIAGGIYRVSVGRGGIGAANKNSSSFGGGDSIAFGVRAFGGGAGGTYNGASRVGQDGASGGGGGTWYPGVQGVTPGGAGVDGQGYAGGACTNGPSHFWCAGGGGGGAGAPGGDVAMAGDTDSGYLTGGSGGAGRLCAIYGTRYYGGGGGGGVTSKAAAGSFAGGLGGGGDGGITVGTSVKPGRDGVDGLGGGGGGGSGYVADGEGGAGGDGGDGVVILRWRQPVSPEAGLPEDAVASGGTVRRRNGHAIHTFTADGTFDMTEPMLVDILLVGGGGGGGWRHGGGGGGGGVVVVSNVYLTSGSYPVTVGAGGEPGIPGVYQGADGGDSVFSFGSARYDLTAFGGGGGGGAAASGTGNGRDGGSGGGSGAPYVTWTTVSFSAGAGTAGQGCAGGTGIHRYTGSVSPDWSTSHAGGGGGAGEPGGDATIEQPGDGGDGIVCGFSGSAIRYGGGGGGGSARYTYGKLYASAGGAGGGGRGGGVEAYAKDKIVAGENGVDGLGGGGGGGGGAADHSASGGRGGSGVVIVRYRVRPRGLHLIVK